MDIQDAQVTGISTEEIQPREGVRDLACNQWTPASSGDNHPANQTGNENALTALVVRFMSESGQGANTGLVPVPGLTYCIANVAKGGSRQESQTEAVSSTATTMKEVEKIAEQAELDIKYRLLKLDAVRPLAACRIGIEKKDAALAARLLSDETSTELLHHMAVILAELARVAESQESVTYEKLLGDLVGYQNQSPWFTSREKAIASQSALNLSCGNKNLAVVTKLWGGERLKRAMARLDSLTDANGLSGIDRPFSTQEKIGYLLKAISCQDTYAEEIQLIFSSAGLDWSKCLQDEREVPDYVASQLRYLVEIHESTHGSLQPVLLTENHFAAINDAID